jgi:hypothetical protein
VLEAGQRGDFREAARQAGDELLVRPEVHFPQLQPCEAPQRLQRPQRRAQRRAQRPEAEEPDAGQVRQRCQRSSEHMRVRRWDAFAHAVDELSGT